ncbi:MAG: glycosyltransferase [Erysipelotrichaceae bacterium]|nr:glycosyltransferase [Erysipelotrichaceae bacterium]
MNVLIVSTTFIPSVLLCGHCQLEYLEKQGKLNYKFSISHFINKRNVEWADIIVFLRSDSDIDAYVSKVARKAGKKLIYVMDDDLLNVPDYLSSSPYYLLPSTQHNIRTIMSNCDTFLTPSPVLLEKYGPDFKYKYNIAEPSLNRIRKKEKNDKVKIGFAGSIDRAQDLNEILEEAITQIVEKYGDSIEIEVMGAHPDFVDKLGLKHLPYQDGYDAYTAYMAKCNWDIGLAPMPLSEFHRCKYFNKYVEYASFGIAGIYTNCEPYIYGIKDHQNGLLVNNTTEEWVNAISELIDNEELRHSISDNCLKEANEIYALDILADDYLKKITSDYVKSENFHIPSLTFAKFIIFFKRVFRKVKEQGLNFPAWFMKKISSKIEDKKEFNEDNNNKETLKRIINERKCMFVIAPYFADSSDDYNQRVRYIDDQFSDYFMIYFSGEDRITEHLKVKIIDDRHAFIVCNSFDILQAEETLELIRNCRNCLIHSVIRFMRDKIANDMYKIFDLEDVKTYWDTHGAIPEEYHEASNFHTEAITSDIEKIFYEKADAIICENEPLKRHFIEKYGVRDIEYIIL